MNEALLEPILRRWRIRRVSPVLKHFNKPTVLDIGCGPQALFLKSIADKINSGIGIDKKVDNKSFGNIETRRQRLTGVLPFSDESFEIVTMLAVLEHIEPSLTINLVQEIKRILKPSGRFVITVPTQRAKPVLELLSYRLGIVSKLEISDHKKYYDKKDLFDLLYPCGFVVEYYHTFQLGFNSFCVVKKGHR